MGVTHKTVVEDRHVVPQVPGDGGADAVNVRGEFSPGAPDNPLPKSPVVTGLDGKTYQRPETLAARAGARSTLDQMIADLQWCRDQLPPRA